MPTLEWIGKNKAVNLHLLDLSYRVLEYRYTYLPGGVNGADFPDGNQIIRGDNLEALTGHSTVRSNVLDGFNICVWYIGWNVIIRQLNLIEPSPNSVPSWFRS